MKNKIIGLFLLLLSYFPCFSQKSYDYTMAIYNKISSFNLFMKDKYKDTFSVMRIETGVLSSENNILYSSSKRKLFYGNEYIIAALTDSRVKNFELKIYNANGDNWTYLDTKVEDVSPDLNSTDLIGHLKFFTITPGSNAIYKFEISTSTQSNTLGRYGIMTWAKNVDDQSGTTNTKTDNDNNTSSKTQLTYNVDNYSISKFDSTTDRYGDFGEQANYSCIFVINANQTVVTQRAPSGSVSTYDIIQKDDTNNNWTIYFIRSTSGATYKFMVPKDGNEYIRVIKTDGNNNNPLTDYHILR